MFIKEISKNLLEVDAEKLIFNYSAILTLESVLCQPEPKLEAQTRQDKLIPIDHAIRKYNKTQKWNILLRLIHEMQAFASHSQGNSF